ncbi:MAG: AmmeMemoRadiSam system protein B [Planctomycetes bacterium]|nr:AmmeMemoRadiSam system protein B [Planctomycetota bacterium]
MKVLTRQAAVAGMFYPADAWRLRRDIEGYTAQAAKPRLRALGVMVPHAGYVYSGAVCGRALASVEVTPRVLILHTKHQPGGATLSLAGFDAWETPLGEVAADKALCEAVAGVAGVQVSNAPHSRDHAAEVVLPFLQVLRPGVKVAVVSVGAFEKEMLEALGRDLAAALKAVGGALIVASSDMNHYDSHEVTLAKDNLALKNMAAFEPQALMQVCELEEISMCGVCATALMLSAAKALGATRVEVLEHTTSGPTSGDFDQVVGYASARVL